MNATSLSHLQFWLEQPTYLSQQHCSWGKGGFSQHIKAKNPVNLQKESYFTVDTVSYTRFYILQYFSSSMCQNNIKHPCRICHRAVATNHRAVNCNACHFWIHIKCNNLTGTQYRKLMDDDTSWLCLKCVNEALRFSNTFFIFFYFYIREK